MSNSDPAASCTFSPCNLVVTAPGGSKVSLQASSRYRLHVALDGALLHSDERRCLTWHKKWTIPKVHVRVEAIDTMLGAPPQLLHALICAGTLRAESDLLHEEGLGGTCLRRLVGGSASFGSLNFKHTSFNCANRPFHLVVALLDDPSLAAATSGDAAAELAAASVAPASLAALAMLRSSPIHIDARKRTQVERPDVPADDVRLLLRPRQNGPGAAARFHGAHPGARARLAAAPAPPLTLEAGAAAATSLNVAALLEATGDALLEMRSDLTISRVHGSTAFGYPADRLVGESLLRLVHPDEQNALQQVAYAIVVCAATNGRPAFQGAGFAAAAAAAQPGDGTRVRLLHRVLVSPAVAAPPGEGEGAAAAATTATGTAVTTHAIRRMDTLLTAITIVQDGGAGAWIAAGAGAGGAAAAMQAAGEQRVVLSSRAALPPPEQGFAGFRVLPAHAFSV